MADSDILVRLRLMKESFDREIREAKQQLAMFKQGAQLAGKALGALGLAMGAVEVITTTFNRTMDATQGTADALAKTMDGAKAGLDTFFQTLSNGDWSNFLNNINEAIKKGRRYSEILDTLSDQQFTLGINDAEYERELAKFKMMVNSPAGTYSPLQLSQQQQVVEAAGARQLKMTEATVDTSKDAVLVAYQKASGNFNATWDDVERYINVSQSHTNAGFEDFVEQMGTAKQLSPKAAGMINSGQDPTSEYTERALRRLKKNKTVAELIFGDIASQPRKEQIARLEALYAGVTEQQLRAQNPDFAKLYDDTNNISDKEREELGNLITSYTKSETRLYSLKNQANRPLTKLSKLLDKDDDDDDDDDDDGGGKKKPKADNRTKLQRLQAQIAELQGKLQGVTDEKEWQKTDNKITELKGKAFEVMLSVKYSPEQLNDVKGTIGRQLKTGGLESIDVSVKPTITAAQAMLKKLREENKTIEAKLKITVDPDERKKLQTTLARNNDSISDLSTSFALTPTAGFKLPRPDDAARFAEGYDERAQAIADINSGLISSFGSIADVMDMVSGDMDNAFSATVRWIGGLLSAVGQAIPAIAALTAANKGKMIAETGAAAAGGANAVAGIPVVGPIMAVAAVASIVAALAAVPKFERGGIVGGNSTMGDRILARVNSGELILNHAQQRVIADKLTAGGVRDGGGVVDFKIRGDVLYGVLNKHITRTNRS